MACFLVPAAEAVVASAVKKAVASKEPAEDQGAAEAAHSGGKVSWKTKLSWLTAMLWGGSALLALEHVWHGEVVLYPPFLTAMSDPADTAAMLQEMGTAGVGMAVLVTAVWAVMALVADHVPAVRKSLALEGGAA